MTMHSPGRRPIANLVGDVRAFAAANGLDPAAMDAIQYRNILDAVLCARIPAERISGRWYYSDGDVPRIAAAFGVGPKASAPAAAV